LLTLDINHSPVFIIHAFITINAGFIKKAKFTFPGLGDIMIMIS